MGVLQEQIINYMPEDPRYPREQQPPAADAADASGADQPPQLDKLPYRERSYDSTAAVIRQLEAGLERDRAALGRPRPDR